MSTARVHSKHRRTGKYRRHTHCYLCGMYRIFLPFLKVVCTVSLHRAAAMLLLYKYRRIPEVWDLPPPTNDDLKGPPQGHDDKPPTNSRSPTPSPTSTSISSASMPRKPPQMERGVSAPCTPSCYYPSSRSSQIPAGSSQAEREDLELGQGGETGASDASASGQGEARRQRGRPSALESKGSLSSHGRVGFRVARSSSAEGPERRSRSSSLKRLVSIYHVTLLLDACLSV